MSAGLHARGVKVLIAAGGSGGHIFPAIALARAIKGIDKDADVVFVGSNKALDRKLFEKEGARFFLLSANKLPYKFTPALMLFFVKLLFDTVRSLAIIIRYRPGVVVGFGGYISFPVVFAAYVMRVPGIAHEQNVLPGRANKVIFALADRVAISFEKTRDVLGRTSAKAVLTGNPIRTDIFGLDRTGAVRRFGLVPEKFTILVIGGSQGAHFLNSSFVDSLGGMDARDKALMQVIHITGVKDYEWALKVYDDAGIDSRVHSFIDRIEEAYAASDLVITRSGASVLFELAYLAKPMVLVPYPFAMSHQAQNAEVFLNNGAAVVLEEKALSGEVFRKTVLGLFRDRARSAALGASAKKMCVPDASGALARVVLDMAR
jgi:UDP-N-acetylglucosamine--N-acetylmuramyl-(pentapeptide) pyrophosphoryl-undecaprenol N-acetylglucosamine transferase